MTQGISFPTRCPKHGNQIDLKPVNQTRTRVTDETNKEQAGYGNYLNLQKIAGEILDYKLNSIRLKIGKQEGGRDAWYKPDYAVWMLDRTLRLDEYKGHWEQAARVRIKAAALQFLHFKFRAVYKDGAGYRYEEF
jgi:hypothetical protein